MHWRIWILLTAFLTSIGLAGWQYRESNRWQQTYADAQENWAADAAAKEESIEALRTAHYSLEENLRTVELEARSAVDRATNLAAQRDHLKAELLESREQTRNQEAITSRLRTELEVARLDVIELRAKPSILQAENAALLSQIEDLQTLIDELQSMKQGLPEGLQLSAISTDRQVFALSGTISPTLQLPQKILLCQDDTVVFEGWLARREGELTLGHVKDWHKDVSELVKDGKVFMVLVE
jgi:predicted  nucleic acid-binding Zn-ribbon protein